MESEEQTLMAICKRIDKLEGAINKREFVKKLINKITDITACDYCGKIISAYIGGIRWYKDGFFQVGTIKGRVASWCSDKCEKHKIYEEIPDNLR
jgi:ribosomal protein L24E